MKALIIYDTYFGNTEQIARAIASAFEPAGLAGVVSARELQPMQLQGIDLLVVGSPTRGWNPSDAVKAFLKGLAPNSLKGMRFAAFDTRTDPESIGGFGRFVIKFGYAAKPIAEALKKAGGTEALPPEGFLVIEQEGPLVAGETERAAEWAKGLRK